MKLNNNFSTDFQHEIDNKSAVNQSYEADKYSPLLSGKRVMWAAMIMNMMVLHSAQAAELTVYRGSGSTFWSDASGSISGTHRDSTSSSGTNGWAFRWNLVPENLMTTFCSDSTTGFVDTAGLGMPPKVGMKIADGIILYFTQGNLKSSLVVTVPQRPEATASLSVDGTMLNLINSSSGYGQRLCASLPSNTAVENMATVSASLTSGKLAVYVDKSAKPGTYNIPAIYLVTDIKSTLSGLVAAGGTLIVKLPPLSCSISTPPPVDFGNIELTGQEKDGDVLGFVNGSVDIICSGDNDSKAVVSSKFTTGTGGRYSDTLALGTDGIAEVRGVIGSAPPTTGWCNGLAGTYPDNYISWNTSRIQKLGTIGVGTTPIPYAFTLCSTGKYGLGKASATSTMEITWE